MFEGIVKNILLGWVPQEVWGILPYWPWILGAVAVIAVAGGLFRVYQLGGWPALTAAVGALGIALGYYLGRSGVKPEDKVVVIPAKPVKPFNKRRPTIFDGFN